ncbi:hypothetical protein GB937_006706 [Aspergillus fischeri]|nr:hypothetical protein GB937_006706 [Aspergillus fischeri]
MDMSHSPALQASPEDMSHLLQLSTATEEVSQYPHWQIYLQAPSYIWDKEGTLSISEITAARI